MKPRGSGSGADQHQLHLALCLRPNLTATSQEMNGGKNFAEMSKEDVPDIDKQAVFLA